MLSLLPIVAEAPGDGTQAVTGFAALLSLVSLLGVILLVVWNFIQMKRVDQLQKRVDALEKK